MGCGVCSKKASRRYNASGPSWELNADAARSEFPAVSSTAPPPSGPGERAGRRPFGNKLGGPLVCLSVGPSHEALAKQITRELSGRLCASWRLHSAGATVADLEVKLAPIGDGSAKVPPCDVLIPLLSPEWLRAPSGIALLRSAQRLRALSLGPELLPLLHLGAFGQRPDALAKALGTPAGELLREVAAPGCWGRLESKGYDTISIDAAVSWLVSRVEALLVAPGVPTAGARHAQRDGLQSWRFPSTDLVPGAVTEPSMAMQPHCPAGMPSLHGASLDQHGSGNYAKGFRSGGDADGGLEGILASAISENGRPANGLSQLGSGRFSQHKHLLSFAGDPTVQPSDIAPMRWATTNAWADAVRQECGKQEIGGLAAEAAFETAWAAGVRQQCGRDEASFRNGGAIDVKINERQRPVPSGNAGHLLPPKPLSLRKEPCPYDLRAHSRRAAWRPHETFRAHETWREHDAQEPSEMDGPAACGINSAPPTPRGREDGWDHFNLTGMDLAATTTEGLRGVPTGCKSFVRSAPSSPRDTTTSWTDPFHSTMRETCGWGSTGTFMDKQFARSKMSDTGTGWGWPLQDVVVTEDDAWEGLDEVDDFCDFPGEEDLDAVHVPEKGAGRRPVVPLGLPPLPSQGEMGMTYAGPFGAGSLPTVSAERSVIQGHFGRFALGAALPTVDSGSGGSGDPLGAKYASTDCNLNRRVVIWHFAPPDGVRAPERTKLIDAVAAQVENLKSVRHPRLCPYLACELIHSDLYVVLGYAPGGSVADWLLDAGEMAEVPTRSVARAVLEGLQHLHEQRTAHGSVRGANVLLGPGTAVRLADFGLGPTLRRSTRAAPWRAPELASDGKGGPTSSAKGDIWAFGCLLVGMLAGHAVSSQVGSLAMDIARQPLLAARLPLRACETARLCLQSKPTPRPSAEQLLGDAWVSCSNVAVLPAGEAGGG